MTNDFLKKSKIKGTRCVRQFGPGIASATLVFQCLAVFALPAALCCCVEMTLATATHDTAHGADHGAASETPGVDEACPHHNLATPAGGERDSGNRDDSGCDRLDQLVLSLAGLIGVSEASPPTVEPLSALGAVPPSTVGAADAVFSVESPPPRA